MLIFSSVLVVLGATLIAVALRRYLAWRKVREWEMVEGKVLEKWVDKKRIFMWPAALDEFYPRITYEYCYKGVPRRGGSITLRDKLLSDVDDNAVRAYLDTYVSPVTVYVDPNNPSRSVLMGKIGRKHVEYLLIYVIVGILFMFFGYLLFHVSTAV